MLLQNQFNGAERRIEGKTMANCKACGAWFSSTAEKEICHTCERALIRLIGYAVPVVRCKDCQYAKLPHTPEMQKLFRRCDIHGVEVYVNNNHFCACGERKDNDV